MTVIEPPDDQAAAPAAKAAADGMVLKDWLKKLAGASYECSAKFFAAETGHPNESNLDARPISEVIAEIMKDVTPEERALLPQDGASQVDHYAYGLPKRF
jgi:hypothetical protein